MRDYIDKYKTILDFIGSNKTILDVGCSVGNLGILLKQRNNKMTGVDINKACTETAKEVYDELIIGDIESEVTRTKIDKKFDVIIYSETLEHLKEPQDILCSQKQFIQKDGFMVVVVPNVAFWRNRFLMFLGNWDYKEEGILDKTHLRFYTLKTIKELISRAGYTIVEVKILFHKKRGLNFLKSLLVAILPGLFGLTFAIKAKPKS
ncbi:MAG: class I SAM-dependent methyltransferase [Candidatus Omnitrophota bacterium]|nr:MAG: class I SAM-dependent methyltransferase [Candidatus Omnitrophota bacterium]